MFIKIYNFTITLLYPLVIRRYIEKRKIKGKEDLKRFNERVGRPKKKRPEGKILWLHGASVGESVSMLPLIHKLLDTYKDAHVMVTTGTTTSAEIMAKRLPERAFHQYITIDNPFFTTRFIKYWKPDLVLWFESDLWPAMLSSIKRKKIPLILVNGRISNKSFKRWQQFDFVSKELLSCFSLCLGQSEQDAYRLRVIGAKNTMCLGNLKYAGLPLPVKEEEKQIMSKSFEGRQIFLASSTHEDEEFRLAKVHKNLKENFSNLLTVIAPRHPQRGVEIKQKLETELGLKVALRSSNEKVTKSTDIYIADTIGELGLWYELCPIVFIGGSLIPHGGQNFIEPSRQRCAVIIGPHTHNFTEAMSKAKKADAIMTVNDVIDLETLLIQLFESQDFLEAKRSLAYNWATSEAKVLDGILEKVKEYLD